MLFEGMTKEEKSKYGLKGKNFEDFELNRPSILISLDLSCHIYTKPSLYRVETSSKFIQYESQVILGRSRSTLITRTNSGCEFNSLTRNG